MNLLAFDGLWWLVGLVVPLVVVQRRLHFEIQAVLLLLTRRSEIAIALFALLFFPGVLLHELSHFLMARLLGVSTGKFSLLPRPMPDGRLQLGFVETAGSDWLREALIGAAPLLAGGGFVAYAGLAHLGLGDFWQTLQGGDLAAVLSGFTSLFALPDFWLWFYLTLAISSTMFPSASDRRAWLPLALVVVGLITLALFAGAGPWLLATLGDPFNQALRTSAVILGISLAVQVSLLLPVMGTRQLASRLTGLEVQPNS